VMGFLRLNAFSRVHGCPLENATKSGMPVSEAFRYSVTSRGDVTATATKLTDTRRNSLLKDRLERLRCFSSCCTLRHATPPL
jgi:hypothetical protein